MLPMVPILSGLIAHLAVSRGAGSNEALALNVTYQGCAEAGLCYPPITKSFVLDMPKAGVAALAGAAGYSAGGAAGPYSASATGSEQDRLAQLIRHGAMPLVLAYFFGFGLLLAFTPCMLPMVPILSGLIADKAARSPRRAASRCRWPTCWAWPPPTPSRAQ